MVLFFKKLVISSNFEGSVSSLSFMIQLRLHSLTYRNSYIVYQKQIFSLTLNYNMKVKWHSINFVLGLLKKGLHNGVRIASNQYMLYRILCLTSPHFYFF